MALPARDSPGGRGARGRILQAALVLFRERGITATGVAELAAAAQVSKRTLYQHFPAKDDVVVGYLRAFEEDPALGPEGVLVRAELSPRARLLELFAALESTPGPGRGCPFIAAAVELADPGHPAHRFAAAHKRRFTERLTELARAAGARQPEQVGRRLALLYDGAATQTVVYARSDVADARTMAAALLHDAID